MSTAVLFSGGLDSAVLLCEEAARDTVQPMYVQAGLAWEAAELAVVERFLAADSLRRRVRPLVTLQVDMRDVYPAAHWAIVGEPPGYHTPDEAVYLPGRNIVLLCKAAVFCAAHAIGRIVLGTLDHNPFPDATPRFRREMAAALSSGLGHALQIDAPYEQASKAEVIRRGARLGVHLELTLSCMSPVLAAVHDGTSGTLPRHCGTCSKCRERREAFREAGKGDPTDYADRAHTGSPPT